MATQHLPAIGDRYVDSTGESFEVIGLGTGGVVVEYFDGRAELIDLQRWQTFADGAAYDTAMS